MATLEAAAQRFALPAAVGSWALPALFVFAALALRAPYYGNPALHVDEQFYLLIGERMLHGDLPYVDVWDRKPVGLFVLYAAIALLPGSGVVAYQIVATLFAAATALVLCNTASKAAGQAAAVCVGLLYLIWINLFQGWGGQSPVFYDLLVAGAAAMVISRLRDRSPEDRVAARGSAAMLLLGLAMQVKYSVAFEGILFGSALLWAAHRDGSAPRRLATLAALWIAVAALPTAGAGLAYGAAGYSHEFVFANFTSILLKAPELPEAVAERMVATLFRLSPLLLLAAVSLGRLAAGWRQMNHSTRMFGAFAGVWLVVAAGSYFLLGNAYLHYVLPLLMPLVVLAALALPNARIAVLAMGALGAFGSFLMWSDAQAQKTTAGDGRIAYDIAATVSENLNGGCLFIFDGPPIVYHLTGACAATKFLFPYHLTWKVEAPAIGVDQVAVVTRIMAEKPAVVVSIEPGLSKMSPQSIAAFKAALGDYDLVKTFPAGLRQHQVYAHRRDRTPPNGARRLK